MGVGPIEPDLGMHVLAAVVWVGGGATMTVLGIVFERRDDKRDAGGARPCGRMDRQPRLRPAVFVVLGFGIAMMLEADIDWESVLDSVRLAGWRTATVLDTALEPFACGPGGLAAA